MSPRRNNEWGPWALLRFGAFVVLAIHVGWSVFLVALVVLAVEFRT